MEQHDERRGTRGRWILLATLALASGCGAGVQPLDGAEAEDEDDAPDVPENEPDDVVFEDAAEDTSTEAPDAALDAGAEAAVDAARDAAMDAAMDAARDAAMDVVDAATDAARDAAMDAADAAVDTGPALVPGCSSTLPTCPTASTTTLTEGAGLRTATHCAFRLNDRNQWAANGALIDRLRATLTTVPVSTVVADGNRDAVTLTSLARVTNFRQGFRWNDGDNTVSYWYPQGITGSGDAFAAGTVGGRRVLLVSWYDNGSDGVERGVRVSFVDITNPRAVVYRHALLVVPRDVGGRATYERVPVHAGGLAWYGRYLYVPDTSRGFRVFDMERILRVPATTDTIGYDTTAGQYSAAGYRYIIPQVDEYTLSGSCPIVFSFVGLDRSTTPHSLVSGEYHTPAIDGRVVRWYLDPATGRLASPYGAREAYFAQQSRMQGVASWNGTWWLSSSSQSGSYGALYRVKPGVASRSFTQPAGVEDLYHDPSTGLLWGVTEHPPNRYVFSAPLTGY